MHDSFFNGMALQFGNPFTFRCPWLIVSIRVFSLSHVLLLHCHSVISTTVSSSVPITHDITLSHFGVSGNAHYHQRHIHLNDYRPGHSPTARLLILKPALLFASVAITISVLRISSRLASLLDSLLITPQLSKVRFNVLCANCLATFSELLEERLQLLL